MLKIYSTLSKKLEKFEPLTEGIVKMYSCGPTVYYYPHIGNMRAYVFMDSLRRILRYNGYKTIGVMNITDVGHLTSDSDSGEDKMETSAKKENKTPYQIAGYYSDIFFADLKKLEVYLPEHITKATEYIGQMIDFVKVLEKKGYTYIIEDGVYFDVSKFGGYGQLSQKDMEKSSIARIEENDQKRHQFDFALWKFVPENHIMKWDSPWGVGCPGWHIECSAMSGAILGDKFDIHTGGIDHLTIHHENEIAQNDCAFGHQVVKYWMHNEFLLVDGGKMSKSLKNIYTISQLEEMGYSPLAFKYFCLNTSYRKKINFTFDGLKSAQVALGNLRKLVAEHKNGTETEKNNNIEKYKTDFLNAINDDLNTPLAIGVLFTMLKNEPKSKEIYNLATEFDNALGLQLSEEVLAEIDTDIPDEISELAEKRWQAKQSRDFGLADSIRQEILQKGYAILDSKDGYKVEKV